MANNPNPNDQFEDRPPAPPSGPSGATDRPIEREKNFEAEGGGQTQGRPPETSERADDRDREDPREADADRDADDRDVEGEGVEGHDTDEDEPDGLSQPNPKVN